MVNYLSVKTVDVYGYEYKAKTFFESAHSKGASERRREINRQNFVCVLRGRDEAQKEAWGVAEGTPRGISGDPVNKIQRLDYIDAVIEEIMGLKIDISSTSASINSIRDFLSRCISLAQKMCVDKIDKPFRGTIAGFETSLLDFTAQYYGISVSELLGQRRTIVRNSTGSISLGTDMNQFAQQAAQISKRYDGWRLKADGADVPSVISLISELLKIDRNKEFIWLDFNQTCTIESAQEIVDAVKKIERSYSENCRIIFEQPIKKKFVKELADLQKRARSGVSSGVPIVIMGDESISDKEDWKRVFSEGGVGAVNIKVQKTGGLILGLDLAEQIFRDDPTVEIYVGNMLNYSDLTRWQLIDFCKTLPRQDYFTSGPGKIPQGISKMPVKYSKGNEFSDKPHRDRPEDVIDIDKLKLLEVFRRTSKMKKTLTNPGRHVPFSTSKASFSPDVMASKNADLGEILKYWGRNVFSNALFEESALKRRANTIRSSGNLFFAEAKNGRKMSIYAQTPNETAPKNVIYAGSKSLGKFIFERDNINTPQGQSFYASQKNAAIRFGEATGYPLVLKPNSGLGGHGVVLGISSKDELAEHFDAAVNAGTKRMLVERQLNGSDHRFLVLKGKTIAVWRRIPAHVDGTGTQTVSELVKEKNGEKAFTFSRLQLTVDSISFLAKQGVSPDTVLEKGQRVFLNNKENLTQGGDAIQMLDGVHPSYYEIAERVAASIPNYVHYAVDLMLEDCTVAATDENWAVLEVNSRPDILGGQYPDQGKPLPLSDIIFEGYAEGQLELLPPTEEDLTVELRLHTRMSENKFTEVLTAISSVVPLAVSGVTSPTAEYHVAKVTGQARYIAMLSTYMFHPKMEKGHNILEVIHL